MFGLLKKRSPDLMDRLKSAYDLEYVTADVSCIAMSVMPKWWRGQASGVPFAIRDLSDPVLIVGRIVAVIDLELSPVSRKAGRFQPEVRVEDFAPELASKYFVSMQGALQERYLGPQLALHDVRCGLADLGEKVKQVGLYRWGCELTLDRSATREDFDADLQAGIRIVRGLDRHAVERPVMALA